jgi:spermidine/putrescine-binding protein
MWPYYDLDTINDPFTEEYGISIETAYFDGNSEAYNQLRSGGAEEFDIVMADSFWPLQYYNDGLIQEIDPGRLPHLENAFDVFHPDNQDLHIADDGAYLGPPNAWGGYGMTYNPDEVPESDVESFMSSLYNEDYSGHISTSARQTMNIANAGMALGYNDPKGSIWEMCDDDQLEEISNLLVDQKDWVITRYNDSRNLDRLYKQGDLWLFPEFSDAYRRLASDGENIRHRLLSEEGGLGWLENWMMTSGVESEAKENAVYAFMDWRLEEQWMKAIAEEVGGAPSVDLRDEFSDRENEIYFQDRVDVFNDLTQFDIPQCPEDWQEYWSRVQSA